MSPEISLAAETLTHVGPLRITNALLTSWIVTLSLAGVALVFRRRLQRVPHGLQNVVEAALEAFLRLVDSVTGNRDVSEKVFPLIATFFVFIVSLNWFGLLPGVGPVGVYQVHHGERVLVPLLRGGNADLNSTLALALVGVLATHLYGLKELGVFRHVGKFVNLRSPIGFFIGLLEALSEFAKILSFSFRLFGNIFAGEVLLLIVASLAPYVAPLPFIGLELFVGFVQALVFSTLMLVFLVLASSRVEH